jgi:protein required for attachment to host cells
MQAQRHWALVLNTTRARILRGLRKDLRQGASELVLRAPHRALRDIMADKPGRTATSSGGGRRAAMEYASDPVLEDARAFVAEVVVVLETHRKAGDFDQLAIFASADMLGMLRKQMTDGLQAIVTHETAKNLLHLSEPDLMRIVREHLLAR